ncbi:MAG TPA: HEAT repeat domain-containing protein [Methanocella sp.]|nr:HEAT repeat domain-containing protein [Methanocella sp.]
MISFLKGILGTDVAGTTRKIRYLGNAKTEEGIPTLINHLQDENIQIRRAASEALEHHWMTGRQDAIAALTNALGDTDPVVRKNAALGIGEFISKCTSVEECAAAKKAMIQRLIIESDEKVIMSMVAGLAYAHDTNLTAQFADAFATRDKKTIGMAIDMINNLPQTDIRMEMKKALRSLL